MSTKELLTIKQVSEHLGISRQAVYNKLDKEFKPYLTIQDGKKLLSRAVLKLDHSQDVSTKVDNNFQSVVNLLDRQNEQLSKELEVKNKQIEELNQRLADTTAALMAAQQTAQAAQALHAGTLRAQLPLDTASESESETGENKKTRRLAWLFKNK